MDNLQVRQVSTPELDPKNPTASRFWPATSNRVTSTDNYQDPMALTHPEYAGKWLAGFAPVGSTGFVVIVQTRETDATTWTALAWEMTKWTGIAGIPATLLLLFAAFTRKKNDKPLAVKRLPSLTPQR